MAATDRHAVFGLEVAPTPEVEMLAENNRRPKLHEVVGRFLAVMMPDPTLDRDRERAAHGRSLGGAPRLPVRAGSAAGLACLRLRVATPGAFQGARDCRSGSTRSWNRLPQAMRSG